MPLHSACSYIQVINIHHRPEGLGCKNQSEADQDITPKFPYVGARPAKDIDLADTLNSPFASFIPIETVFRQIFFRSYYECTEYWHCSREEPWGGKHEVETIISIITLFKWVHLFVIDIVILKGCNQNSEHFFL